MRAQRPGATVAWFAGALLVLAAHAAFLGLVVRPDTGDRVLHYTTVFGIDLVGPGIRLWYTPAVGLIALVLNLAGFALLRRSPVARLIGPATFAVECVFAIATLAVVRQTLV